MLLFLSLLCLPRQSPAASLRTLEIRECLAIQSVGRYGRSPVHTDAIEARLVAGTFQPPHEGEAVTLPDGSSQTWTSAKADRDGWFSGTAFSGGYAYAEVQSPADSVMLLEASGHALVYVNGEPRGGDPYGYGWLRLPVALKKGPNRLLFLNGRGRLRARLLPPRRPVTLDASDATLPDLIAGRRGNLLGALVVINATTRPLHRLYAMDADPARGVAVQPIPDIPPLSVRKVPVRLLGWRPGDSGQRQAEITLMDGARQGGIALDSAKLTLRVRSPDQTRKVTFISGIDGSVQYYAVNPSPQNSSAGARALFLSLHGASVEAIGQADAYSAKRWGDIVCPTNRRPFGFDWEDWGRMDAMETLGAAVRTLKPDSSRIYLTGHSMGGHGTWQIGVNFPGRFAAIGPSAGWVSFWSYAGGRRAQNPGPVESLLQRAANPSDTLALARNLSDEGVYILHGAADDNVPVTEARAMAAALTPFHRDFTLFEQPNAGHWWDASDEPGADCVDWAPMFDLFARSVIPAPSEVREVEFTTMNPGINAWDQWAGIVQQQRSLEPSRVRLRCDPGQRRFSGSAINVACLCLRLDALAPGLPFRVEIDGAKLPEIPWPQSGDRVWLRRSGEEWRLGRAPAAGEKGPDRAGPFKEAFNRRFVLVYGTRGTPEEKAWAFNKARYDAEQWYYRGNGAVDILADAQFAAAPPPGRSVILYGNADTNAAWAPLLGASPVLVSRSTVRVGARTIAGADLACLFVRPRPGDPRACVAAVAGTGMAGLRLTERLPYFTSGVAYPDVTILGADSLAKGVGGARAAGFFGPDWQVESGEFAWAGPKQPH